ncbi:MAG: hypothetical protein JWL70_575 [Acidimicrobiia bacterium]|nr:hypothetical protein [Acidimicrobiia bacterium]
MAEAADLEEVEPVAGGKRWLQESDAVQIRAEVDRIEQVTGLQLCVYVGPAAADSRAFAEDLFHRQGLAQRPAILVLVAPAERRIEVLTAPSIVRRVPNAGCKEAVSVMAEAFGVGAAAAGIIAGLQVLEKTAGPGLPGPDDVEWPDLLED